MTRPIVETVRVSAKGKEVLSRVKRRTGLEHWNEICRVALARSLADPSNPMRQARQMDTAIEIEWKTFAGSNSALLAAAVRLRAHRDGMDPGNIDDLASYFRSHLERGIANLNTVRTLPELIAFLARRPASVARENVPIQT